MAEPHHDTTSDGPPPTGDLWHPLGRHGHLVTAVIAPTLLVTIVMTLLVTAYLGGSVDPERHLKDFPVAVVNADRGATLPNGQTIAIGSSVADAMGENLDPEKFRLLELDRAQAESMMADGELYGAVVLPETLSSDAITWAMGTIVTDEPVAGAPGSATPETVAEGDPVVRPTAVVLTNDRVGAAATTIGQTVGTRVLETANEEVGAQLHRLVDEYIRALDLDTEPGPTARAALDRPLDIVVEDVQPLEDGSAGGLSAFYYALLIVLAGFTGSMIATTLIDFRLGVMPTEAGPVLLREKLRGLSRVATLLLKWFVAALLALSVSAAFVLVGSWVGMPVANSLQLWGFGAAMIFAVSLAVNAINAIVGNAGLLINLFVFVVLGIPSSGGTMPVEAVPGWLRFLGGFEPMHQIYLGVRSVLYFDGTWSSGIDRAVVAATVSSLLAVLVGLLVMWLYDRGFRLRGREVRGGGAGEVL